MTLGEVKAVDDVSFTIAAGETLGLVGESGCGKTTTSKLILNLEQPTGGQVLLDGKPIHGLRGEALREYRALVQAVFQDPWSSLNPRMTVGRIIAEIADRDRLGRRAEDRRARRELLEQVGLRPEQATQYPHEFSGGQRQRIALAGALASRPRLIVLDEPVSALDVSIRAQMMNLLKDVQAQDDVAYLLVAHDLATVRYMADDTVVMYLGKIVEYAPTRSLFDNVRHPYTKALLSAVLPPRVDRGEDEIVVLPQPDSPTSPSVSRPAANGERDVVHRLHLADRHGEQDAFGEWVVLAQVLHPQQRLAGHAGASRQQSAVCATPTSKLSG